MIKKHPRADLRSYHTILLQSGLIVVLIATIAATNMEFKIQDDNKGYSPVKTEFIPEIEIPITKDKVKPVPQKPSVFTEIPNPDPIDIDPIDFGPEDIFSGGNALPLPPKNDTEPEEPVETFMLELKPELKGGIKNLYSKIKYPKVAQQAGIEGRVYVEFIIDKEGNVTNPQIIRGIGGGCDEEVLRVIKLMKFTPGIQNGRFVKVKMRQGILFELEN